MLIEFVGLSGAGKTFIARQLKSYLQERISSPKQLLLMDGDLDGYYDATKNSRSGRRLAALRFRWKLFCDRNFLSLLLTRIKARGRKKFSMKYIMRMFSWYYKAAEILEKNGDINHIFIADEGFLTRSGFMFQNRECDTLEEFTGIMERINAVKHIEYGKQRRIYVFVLCNEFDEVIKRVIERGSTSIYLRISEDGRTFHRKALKALDLAREYLNRINADYIVINNDTKQGNFSEQFRQIKAKLEEKYSLT